MQHLTEFGKWCKNCKYYEKSEDDLWVGYFNQKTQPIHYEKSDNAWCQTCKYGDQTEDNEPCLSECKFDPKTKKPSCYVKREKPGKEPEKNAGKRRKLL